MSGDSGGGRRNTPGPLPIIGVGGRQWDCPPTFVVFVSTLNSEEYSSTPTLLADNYKLINYHILTWLKSVGAW